MRVVVLGTGTNVGKTYVTACIARDLSRLTSVLAVKPIESGVVPGEAGDAGAIASAAGHDPKLSPWRLARAVSPHLAAREQAVTLEPTQIAAWVKHQEQGVGADVTLVETAGGAFSPLARGVTNVDLALALDPALWLLVAPDSLGVLHDVTVALRALPRAPDIIVLSAARDIDPSSGSNAPELLRLGICEVLETVSRGATGAPAVARWLADHPTFTSTKK
jgi:dethiobiotin synthetase